MLEERGTPYTYREYTKDPLSEDEVRAVLAKLGAGPRDILRLKDYRALELPAEANDDQLIGYMAKHPGIIQRPIAILGDRALLARPADKLTSFLDELAI